MADNQDFSCGACVETGGCGSKAKETLLEGVWNSNPVAIQMLGICSALAVTSRLDNSLVMGAALIFVSVGTNLFVSVLRKFTPRRIRMIAEVTIIATFVIVFDQLLKAYYWDMSQRLGPYVALIITNCIIMGRAESYAMQNPPLLSMVDGAANGLGYAGVLAVIGFSRELLGTGKVELFNQLFNIPLDISRFYHENQLMILAPGAFFALGFLIAGYNMICQQPNEGGDNE